MNQLSCHYQRVVVELAPGPWLLTPIGGIWRKSGLAGQGGGFEIFFENRFSADPIGHACINQIPNEPLVLTTNYLKTPKRI